MSDFLALVAIIVAIVLGLGTIAVTVYLHKKQNPRREFSYDIRSTPLVSSRARGLDKLAVSYDGSLLHRPYLVNMVLHSSGRADISSSSFDGGRPISIELGVPVLAEIQQITSTNTVDTRLAVSEGQTFIELLPSLLPKGFSIGASYLCDGKPNPRLTIGLTDIPVRANFLSTPAYTRAKKYLPTVASVLAGVMGAVLPIAIVLFLNTQGR